MHGRQGRARTGRAGTARRPARSPVCTGASRPRSHSRRPIDVLARRRAGPARPRRPARRRSRCAVVSGSAGAARRARSASAARWSRVEGAEQGQRAGGHRPPGIDAVARHRLRSAQWKLSHWGSRSASAVRVAGMTATTSARRRRPASISAEIEAAAATCDEPAATAADPGSTTRRYRSSLLRHPTQAPPRRPRRATELAGAGASASAGRRPARGRPDASSTAASRSASGSSSPAGSLDGDGRPVRAPARRDLAGQRRRAATSTSATSTRRRSTRTSPASAAA